MNYKRIVIENQINIKNQLNFQAYIDGCLELDYFFIKFVEYRECYKRYPSINKWREFVVISLLENLSKNKKLKFDMAGINSNKKLKENICSYQKNKILLYLIDSVDQNPFRTYKNLENEVFSYNPDLAIKPTIICRTKADIKDKLSSEWDQFNQPVYAISSLSGLGLKNLISVLSNLI